MPRPIRIIDKRNKHYFMVDDVYLNGYARLLGPIPSMVYISLCRHVDKDQSAFPSQELIAKEIGTGLRSVENAIALLKRWNLIEITRDKKERKWARNLYYLLDKDVWNKPSPALDAVDEPLRSPANDDIDHPHQVLTKDTHTKDTHIKRESRENSLAFLEDLPEEQIIEITTKYKCTDVQLRDKADTLRNYCLSHGKRYKDYRAFLLNAVKKDFGPRVIKIIGNSEVDWDNILTED